VLGVGGGGVERVKNARSIKRNNQPPFPA